jgi:hypothetical protein
MGQNQGHQDLAFQIGRINGFYPHFFLVVAYAGFAYIRVRCFRLPLNVPVPSA